MKKRIGIVAMVLTALILGGCSGKSSSADVINVISREEGSGTRGAFVELFQIEEKNEDGKKLDMITVDAQVTNSTAVMTTAVAGDKQTIGYISLGTLNDSVKALKIDGAEPSAENIKDGSYKISRPFYIATKDNLSEAAADFIKYIMSEQGQAIVEENGYIAAEKPVPYIETRVSGKVVVAGSSSVTPVMEKLAEAYQKRNRSVAIEIQQSDSTTGVAAADNGLCDIGMVSRELKESEKELGLTQQMIALDGIVVIANLQSEISELKSEHVKDIFAGNITEWSGVK